MKPLYDVSVIIPVCHVEPYVEKCLASVLRQTLPGFELILLDDCGTDGSMAVIGKVLEREFPEGLPERVKILRNPRNMGAGPSRNNGMDAASGEYIAFIDSDDWIEEDYLEALYRAAKKENADVVLCGYRDVAPDGTLLRVVEPDCENVEIERYRKLRPWAHLYRREFLERCRARFLDVFMEDTVFNLSIAWRAERAVIIPDTGYCYVWRPGSISRKNDGSPAGLPFRELSDILPESEKNGIRPEDYTHMEYVIVKAYTGWLFDLLRHGRKEHTDYFADQVTACLDAAAPRCYENPYLALHALPALPLTARVGTYLFAKAYQHRRLRQFTWIVTRF